MARDDIGDRIRIVRKRAGLSQQGFAERLGVTPATINRYEKRHRLPDADFLNQLVAEFNCEPGWLLTGEGPQFREERKEVLVKKEVVPCNTRFQEVKVYSLAGAGQPKELVTPEPIDVIIVPGEFIKPSVVPVKVRGESMVPTIYEGAIVGVDREDTAVISGKVYAVWIPYEGAVIKRLYIDAEKITLKSDNPLFPAFSILLQDVSPDNFILGRV